jgi:hypothetical protein
LEKDAGNEYIMDLKEYCYSLESGELLTLALRLCDKAYPIWSDYCKTSNLTYRDTVVGMSHTIEERLLSDALSLSHPLQTATGSFSKEQAILMEEFLEPITALEDDDWLLPRPVERVFFAVYNLLYGFKEKKNSFDELIHYLSVNQAVEALYTSEILTVDQIRALIYGNKASENH